VNGGRLVARSDSAEALAGHRLENGLLLLDDRLEARSREDARDVGRQPGPTLRIDLALAMAKAHELDARRDVGDRELVTDQPIIVAEFSLQVVE